MSVFKDIKQILIPWGRLGSNLGGKYEGRLIMLCLSCFKKYKTVIVPVIEVR